MPMGAVGDLVVRECKASEFVDCDIVFSGLDSDVAGEIGMFRRQRVPDVFCER
jgi:aspartate-semialdehyde dehydrogenase